MNATVQSGSAEMADLAFSVRGEQIPSDYRHALWTALHAAAPWLEDEPRAGILGIRTVATERGVCLLARRANLTLRLPMHRLAAAAAALEGRRIEVAGEAVEIGTSHVRPLPIANTLYADFVTTGSSEETRFQNEVAEALTSTGVSASVRFICGRPRTLHAGGEEVSGYAVVLHELRPDDALTLLHEGLGGGRKLGCGIFIQHKAIAGLG
jgi:CRISPR-associated protein Cas6